MTAGERVSAAHDASAVEGAVRVDQNDGSVTAHQGANGRAVEASAAHLVHRGQPGERAAERHTTFLSRILLRKRNVSALPFSFKSLLAKKERLAYVPSMITPAQCRAARGLL